MFDVSVGVDFGLGLTLIGWIGMEKSIWRISGSFRRKFSYQEEIRLDFFARRQTD